jgi:hypothetical protein
LRSVKLSGEPYTALGVSFREFLTPRTISAAMWNIITAA